MVKIKRYKKARKLGPEVFDKTQTQKFTLSEQKKAGPKKRPKQKSDYGLQLIEKQKLRYFYGIREKQLVNYVRDALNATGAKPNEQLIDKLERRLDSVVYRLGFALSRQHARQIVVHGHIQVNGRRVNIPSYEVSQGDTIGIKESSRSKGAFIGLDERLAQYTPPAWLALDYSSKQAAVQGAPKLDNTELVANVGAVLEFYSR